MPFVVTYILVFVRLYYTIPNNKRELKQIRD